MATDLTPQTGTPGADGPTPAASRDAPDARRTPPGDPRAAPGDRRAAPGDSVTHTEALYTARVRNRGGTAGEVIIQGAASVELGATTAGSDGTLSLPTGGPSAESSGFDPEQLLAAAWSTCLGETLKVVLAEHGHRVGSRVDVEVELHRDPSGGYRFAPRALVEIDELPTAEAAPLIEAAHARCPVSKLLAATGQGSVTHRITH